MYIHMTLKSLDNNRWGSFDKNGELSTTITFNRIMCEYCAWMYVSAFVHAQCPGIEEESTSSARTEF